MSVAVSADEAAPGPYSAVLDRILKAWPVASPPVAHDDPSPVHLTSVRTPDEARLVGAVQTMLVDAPLARVVAVIDDFAHYKDLSPDFDEIRVLSRDATGVLTSWNRHVPIFFLPNLRYEMRYTIDRAARGRVIFRYRLVRSEQLRSSDGFILVENASHGQTRFSRYDFIGPMKGVFASAPSNLIWENALHDLFISTAGMKLKAEHPDWSYERIVAASRDWLERFGAGIQAGAISAIR